MISGRGISVFGGIAVADAFFLSEEGESAEYLKGSVKEEHDRFGSARREFCKQMEELMKGTEGEAASVAELQLLLSCDADWTEAVEGLINEGRSAPEALILAGKRLSCELAALEDEYMQARAEDIYQVSRHICDILTGVKKPRFPSGNFILFAPELSPALAIELPKERVMGMVIGGGSASGHTAIIARSYGIPTIINTVVPKPCKEIAAIDSERGIWYLCPDKDTLSQLMKRAEQIKREQLFQGEGELLPCVTKNGKRIRLYANIGSHKEAQLALERGCEGVGLLRSELLYLGRTELPAEEELFEEYKATVKALKGRELIVRTLDIGGDKPSPCIPVKAEENPALGMRGIRLCLEREDIFLTQLRAVYRASEYGRISLMLPMICSVWELERAKELCEGVRAELGAERLAIGVMIETPSAAVIADELARHADFFSVGTNDLIQYTLACDRQNGSLGRYCDPKHPAIIKLLWYIAGCAKGAGIWCGICGELASYEELTDEFIKMGYTELSVSPTAIPKIRKRICRSEL